MKHGVHVITLALLLSFVSHNVKAGDLIYSSFLNSSHATNTVILPNVIDRVAAETDNKVRIIISAGGVLTGPNETLATLQYGAVDAALMIYVYTPRELPSLSFVGSLYTTNRRCCTNPLGFNVLRDHATPLA